MSEPETFEALLVEIEGSTFEGLVEQCGPELRLLMSIATSLFEQFPVGDQVMAMSLMLGMCHAELEGQPVTAEQTYKRLLTEPDRLAIFLAQYRVSYRAALLAKTAEPPAGVRH